MKKTQIAIVVLLIMLATVLENASRYLPDPKILGINKQKTYNPFNSVEVEAQAVFVYDVKNNRPLYSKNESAPLPLASLTKIMTALVAMEYGKEDMLVTISKNSLGKQGDTGLKLDEKWKLSDLVKFTLTTSSNDGANAISNAVEKFLFDENQNKITFVNAMNREAINLGLNSFYFGNETGLDEGDSASSYGSAKDVSLLLYYLLKNYPNVMETTAYNAPEISSINSYHQAQNTNKDVMNIPGIIASKTGFTDIAGGNLIIALNVGPAHTIIITVLGSTQDGRFKDVKNLITPIFEAIKIKTL